MKNSMLVGIIVLALLCSAVLFEFIYNYMFIEDFIFYTKIDNSKIKEIESDGGVIDIHGGMKYEYNLVMYEESGNGKEIKFGTNRKLKDNAYIKVYYFFIRGVHKWEEIDYDELPEKVKEIYDK